MYQMKEMVAKNALFIGIKVNAFLGNMVNGIIAILRIIKKQQS